MQTENRGGGKWTFCLTHPVVVFEEEDGEDGHGEVDEVVVQQHGEADLEVTP